MRGLGSYFFFPVIGVGEGNSRIQSGEDQQEINRV